ncbi:hypothetical protein XHC_0261 [Xanthomonas hortorum pv. carotae str. M081]|nr:hypothetical protein XHC_0261 [Xanthomonas hortorum pv. carotae str. M081]
MDAVLLSYCSVENAHCQSHAFDTQCQYGSTQRGDRRHTQSASAAASMR